MSLSTARVRIKLDASSSKAVIDQLTGKSPDFYRGETVSLELGVFYGADLQTIANLDRLIIQIKDISDKDNATPIIEKEVLAVDFNTGLTLVQWNQFSAQHATVEFSSTETNIDLSGADSKQVWLVVGALRTTGERIVLGTGAINIMEDGWVGEGGSVPPTSLTFRIQSGTGDPQIKNSATGLYHTLYIEDVGGTLVLTLDQTGDS